MRDAAKILIVDDDRDLVETLRVVLTHHGYEVLTAPDAPDEPQPGGPDREPRPRGLGGDDVADGSGEPHRRGE